MVTSFALRMWYKERTRRKIAETRRIEAPNSHYSSLGVRQQEDHDRGRDIDLFELHPLNRDEVERLLVSVDLDGVKSLSPRDRLFLDNMILPRLST
ncbi:MAG: hypothetical protein P8L45_06270 [Longimicrobiales bacterium]|nr:hypothetical protein [Longimicrobiales bacterium]